MFRRIAVVNRGEAAVRLIRAVRELNAERGTSIRTVALHTQGEAAAMFVRQADEAVALRPSTTASVPYLDYAELERALVASGADAVWVGWGFVSEHPAFVELCDRLGIAFLGPPAEAMRLLGDKIEAKLVAERVGVPVAAWSGAGGVTSYQDALRHASRIGYPLIIKAKAGGGGRGIRKVLAEEELEAAFEGTRADAARYFGDDGVFLEALVTGARHVEVQIIADAHGNVWAPGVRDCSIQRRNQKIIEESASPVLTPEQSLELRRVSTDLVKAVGYRGAGTVEYLYDPVRRAFAFLEVNTRLQVEHPITEAATGIDLVKLQILIAAGEPLPGECPPEINHAIEIRLNAEDPDNGFAPAPGRVALLEFPQGPGIRVDSGIAAGDTIPPEFDSMVAKIIAIGRDRTEAMARLTRALRDTTVVIEGGTTNKSFVLELLSRPEVRDGSADTAWLDRGSLDDRGLAPHADVALYAVAVDSYEREEFVEREAFLALARGGRPQADHAIGRTIEARYGGHAYSMEVAALAADRYRVTVRGVSADVDVQRLSDYEWRLTVHGGPSGGVHRVVLAAGPNDHLVEVDGVSHRVGRDSGGVVRAPAPAVIVALPVGPGDVVEAGQTVAVLEAMKMETPVAAPFTGRVREILATPNSQVPAGAPLLRLDPEGGEAAVSDLPEVTFAPCVDGANDLTTDPAQRALDLLEALRALVTGYDVSAAEGRALVAEYGAVRRLLPAQDSRLVAAELAVLRMFADICELSRNRPSAEEEKSETRVHSPREYLHTYLRSLDVEREGLPESFRSRLSRALVHYGVADLEPTEHLKDAVYRVFLALARGDAQTPVVTALLERWLDAEDLTLADQKVNDELAEVLERLVNATRIRYPLIGDLARSVRFRHFDQPLILAARERALASIRAQIDHLVENPDAPDRAERIEALVTSPETIIGLLNEYLGTGVDALGPLLEVQTRRYYRSRDLENARLFVHDNRQVMTSEFDLADQRLHLIATVGDFTELPALAAAVGELAAEHASDDPRTLVLDFFLSWDDLPGDYDEVSSALRAELDGLSWPASLRRITIGIAGGTTARTFYLTFRPSAPGSAGELEEDRLIRGLHPLVAQRLGFSRLVNFDLTRLPADDGVYLYRATGKTNADDERVIALAEIRDVHPLRDASGRVLAVPTVERVLTSCVQGIRSVQARRPAGRRLDRNRIVLAVSPTAIVPLDELDTVTRGLVPMTAGAGLEEVLVVGRFQDGSDGEEREAAVMISYTHGVGAQISVTNRPTEPIPPLDDYEQKVRASRARGAVYPYELVGLLIGTAGTFFELDLDETGELVPVDREPGQNSAGIIVGLVTSSTPRYPEGLSRVVLMGDPTKSLGSLAEPECARVIAALDLAEAEGFPVEWFALSAGARISMDSGVENMDWIARALRRIVEFTQAGGEVNVVVAGINVGAQPYWNAEATMLMHTKGVLIMTPDSAMVLTGKQSLDYSGGVSAEDNFGIGGYDRVMGPNGQAQYWAPNLAAAAEILFAHYDHAYRAAGERFPRRVETTDPFDRDVRLHPHIHPGCPDFQTVGDIFSAEKNPERKKPFDIRTVMRAVVDSDHAVLERWAGMADADTSVVFDAHLGGQPVTVIGIESRPVPRRGYLPSDGPDVWTGGTLFPQSSKKTARAINAASGVRPLVVLANLSGFDGSPESLRNLQLEYGAEIGRAMVNFDGPIVFCLISRYHGGAFVVFSGTLNDNMEVVAVEGSFASVLGGAPAAAVVFTAEVRARTNNDERIRNLEARLASASGAEAAQLRVELADLRNLVKIEKQGEVAAEFEGIHDIRRAQKVGSVHTIISAAELRPYLISAVERGMARTLNKG
ncbi:carboxyl transferase domain-containing protein [Sporichthya polymorpha]|uniref:ATP-binding protein n=1 Tax=Sporichthya polymorpha TaxID=35751 RepID=UPI00036AA606|nr:carboxyl transferase domain-containing protein [Sporichthya polymorpha]